MLKASAKVFKSQDAKNWRACNAYNDISHKGTKWKLEKCIFYNCEYSRVRSLQLKAGSSCHIQVSTATAILKAGFPY